MPTMKVGDDGGLGRNGQYAVGRVGGGGGVRGLHEYIDPPIPSLRHDLPTYT